MSVQYTATVKVVIPQLVHCVHCNCKFVYEMTVEGYETVETGLFTGDKAARAAAEKGARDHLDRQLDNPELCHAIPCRSCFRYQPYMYKMVGQSRYDDMGCLGYPLVVLGFLAAVGSGVACIFVKDDRPILIGVALVGLLVWLGGYLVLKRMHALVAEYDPNEHDLEGRKKRAAERALTLVAYDEMQAERVRKAYNEHREAPHTKPWQQGNPFADSEGLVVEWWVEPSMFSNSGAISIRLDGNEHVTVLVPDDAKPGDLFHPRRDTPNVIPFQVRLVPIRVHPDEQRLE
jgi:hypothetical protein